MSTSVIINLKKVLSDKQLKAYIRYSDAFLVYYNNKTRNNLKEYNASYEAFLTLTNGKAPCEIIPISVW